MGKKVKVVIIHGSYGTPEENWFPWLADMVEKKGYEAIRPKLPTPENQNLDNWRKEFKKQVGELDEDMILVGHSLAPGFILNLLEESSNKVFATFMVSCFLGKLGLEDFDPINSTFVCKDFDWEKIKENAGEIYIYNSDNDPYVPLEKGQQIADNLGVKLNVIKNGGHINKGAGFEEFPQLFNDISNKIDSK